MTHSFNRLTTIAALDIGSSKVCCVIAKISRDKRINVVGYGYNASKGIKNGIVTDINQATLSVCNAVETAEQMANERIDRIIVNISGDKIKSIVKDATIAINKNRPVSEADITKVIEKGINKINVDEHELIHCLPTSYRLDMGDEIKDPRNIFGESLSVDILLGLVPEIQYRNLSTVIENAHLETAEKAFSAYASGLSCLVEDEKEIGATVIDIGGGSTEIIIGQGMNIRCSFSCQMGAVRLFQRIPIRDHGDLDAVEQIAADILTDKLLDYPVLSMPGSWRGTGGTFTTLAAMVKGIYWTDRTYMHGTVLTEADVARFERQLADMTLEQRKQLPGLQPNRADIVVHGICILRAIMRRMHIGQITVSEYGNLDGYFKRKYIMKKK